MTAKIRPLRHLLDPARPLTYGIVQAGEHVADGVPYIRPVDMTATMGVLDESSLPRTDPSIARQYARSSLRAGDIVMSIGPSYGKVMIVPSTLAGANLTQGTARLAPGADLVGRWLFWWLQSEPARQFWDASVSGATFRALNLGPLGETPTPVMTKAQQEQIADCLDAQAKLIEEAVSASRRQLALLESYKHSLITELMTGPSS